MRLKVKPNIICLIFALCLSACGGYQEPVAGDGQPTASIIGSKADGPGSTIKIIPNDVDGQHINHTTFVFHTIQLTPGTHDIHVTVLRPWTFPFQSGDGDIKATFAPGQSYILRVGLPEPSVSPDGQASSWANQCKVWIETSDGKPVVNPTEITLHVPSPGPVPIFVPVR